MMITTNHQWIGLRENLQETMVFTIEYRHNIGVSCKFSHHPIRLEPGLPGPPGLPSRPPIRQDGGAPGAAGDSPRFASRAAPASPGVTERDMDHIVEIWSKDTLW